MDKHNKLSLEDDSIPLVTNGVDDEEYLGRGTSMDFERKTRAPPLKGSQKVLHLLKEHLLLFLTFGGVVIGLVVGIILNANSDHLSKDAIKIVGFPGELLLRMLKMLVLPLISASIIVGISSLSSPNANGDAQTFTSREKRIFSRTIIYFLSTTVTAVILGIIVISIIKPGTRNQVDFDGSVDPEDEVPPRKELSALDSILDVFRSMFPSNLIKAAADMDILGIITFSLVLGGTLVQMGEMGQPLLKIFESLNEAIMRIVMLIMWYAPFGIMSLIAARLAENGNFIKVLSDIGLFALTVVVGLTFHVMAILPAIYYMLVKKNPYKLYWGVIQAIVTAIGTDSSAATLPVTLKCIKERGVSDKIAQIVLPLGVTLNMNGTALYEAVSALFIAQLHGIELNIGQTIIVALTSTLAAIGAAGIPEAGLITMTMVLTSVGLPLSDIGLLLTIDWFLDRYRTVVNVLGDVIGAAIIDHYYQKEGGDNNTERQ